MKKVMCTICLLVALLVSGCTPVYLFQPGKTLEECRKDARECTAIALKNQYPVGPLPLYHQYMQERGYLKMQKKQLPPGTRVRQVDTLALLFLAGE